MADSELQISRPFTLLDLWQSVHEKKITFGSIVLISIAASIAVALLSTPVYRAEAIITPVENDGGGSAASLLGRLGNLAGLAGVNLTASGGNSSKAWGVLTSRALIEEFIRMHDLIPILFPLENPNSESSIWRAVERFQDIYAIQRDMESGLITVQVDWLNPNLAAEWANNIVRLANETLRQRDLADTKRNIDYLNEQISRTNVMELHQVAYNLIEAEMNTLMLANARQEYAFAVIDPAVPPEIRARPRRKQIVVLGGLLGAIFGFGSIVGLKVLEGLKAEYDARRRFAAR
jgi:uncharacterized protein involved in exopolysaccharide biosynthesis